MSYVCIQAATGALYVRPDEVLMVGPTAQPGIVMMVVRGAGCVPVQAALRDVMTALGIEPVDRPPPSIKLSC